MGRTYEHMPLRPLFKPPEPVPGSSEQPYGPWNINSEITVFQKALLLLCDDESLRKKRLQTINKSIRKTCWVCSKKSTERNFLRPYKEVENQFKYLFQSSIFRFHNIIRTWNVNLSNPKRHGLISCSF